MAGDRTARTWFARRAPRQAAESPRPYGSASEAELMCWLAHGDRKAFDEVINRHGAFALRVALRLTPDSMAAEDVVQEVMMRIWSHAQSFNPNKAQFRTWLYRIILNLCIDYGRRARPEPMPENFDPIDPAAGAQDVMEANERRAALVKALKELPVRQRAAMMLIYDEGMSGAEAARVLGLSQKAVEKLLARARASLRKRLRPDVV